MEFIPSEVDINSYRVDIEQVVVVLPYVGLDVLMQLRDDMIGIAFPNKWGFFGGSIEPGETPFDAGKRELHEEIGLIVEKMLYLGCHYVPEVDIVSHAYCCPLQEPISNLRLEEGQEMALLSLEEIASGKFISPKNGKEFQVVSVSYMADSVRRMIDAIEQQQEYVQ